MPEQNTTTTHTPWRAEKIGAEWTVWKRSPGHNTDVALAGAYSYPLTEEDARLIAAAPDLLAALEAVVRDGYWTAQSQVSAALKRAKGDA